MSECEETISPLYVRLDKDLKFRLVHQCKRLGISQTAATKMSIVKFLEEEEKIEAVNQQR